VPIARREKIFESLTFLTEKKAVAKSIFYRKMHWPRQLRSIPGIFLLTATQTISVALKKTYLLFLHFEKNYF